MKEAYLAIDFGGGSGRVIAGYLSEGELVLDTIYRFPNRQVRMGGHVYWDFLSLFEDMKTGIRMAVEKGYTLKSIGIDTWSVDFGLIDKQGNLLGNPVCYRDSRTEGMPEEFFSKVDVKAHYAESGTQVMAINTLFQLYAMKKEDNAQLKVADSPRGVHGGPGLLDAVVPLGEDLAGAGVDDSRRVPRVSTPAGVGCTGKRPQSQLVNDSFISSIFVYALSCSFGCPQ